MRVIADSDRTLGLITDAIGKKDETPKPIDAAVDAVSASPVMPAAQQTQDGAGGIRLSGAMERERIRRRIAVENERRRLDAVEESAARLRDKRHADDEDAMTAILLALESAEANDQHATERDTR